MSDNQSGPSQLPKKMKMAVELQKRGDLAGAEALYNEILSRQSDYPDALHLLGLVHHHTGRMASAIDLISRAISRSPANPYYYNSLGSMMRGSGKIEKALHCYKKSLSLKSDYPEALYNIAGLYHFSEKYEDAVFCYQKAIQSNPVFPEALNNLAATFNVLERYDEALSCCRKAVQIRPNYNEAYNNMGNTHMALGNFDIAVNCYERSIRLGGKNAEVLCNLGNALVSDGMTARAIKIYQQAIEMDPSYGKAYNNLGTVFRTKRELIQAEYQFRKCISLIPNDPDAYHNMGNVLYDKGDYLAAASWYDKAISINPKSVQTIINRGIIYQECGDSDNALNCFNSVLNINANHSKALCHKAHELYHRCEWAELEDVRCKIAESTEEALKRGKCPIEMPFLCLIRTEDSQTNFRVAEKWSNEVSKNIGAHGLGIEDTPYPRFDKTIKIGYLSNNFKNHPTSHLVRQIFEIHDRDHFEINAYSYGEDDGSVYRRSIQQSADKFVDLSQLDHLSAARQIFNDKVDILVDLVGYMRGNRLEICAYRPAPIQVRWLGLAGTTGADFFDFLITDEIVTPKSNEPLYSEKFVYMPDTYQVNSEPMERTTTIFTRKDQHLPEFGVVYCCFCSSYKIDAGVFRLWMEILTNVPESVLWLLRGNKAVMANLSREAERCGVNPERLVFADKVPKEDHLERLKLADLALDTFIVNGAATTSDALWAGVPVLTLRGNHFASRMSTSILKAIGLDDLSVDSNSDYMRLAVKLGREAALINSIKDRLHLNRSIKPLFNTSRFIKNLEIAYREMWRHHVDGERKKLIRING